MHPEPWPAAQHLPVIALAILLCAALVTASLIGARLRLGQVREADTRRAQFDLLSDASRNQANRISQLKTNNTVSIASLNARAAEIEARLDMLSASINAEGFVGITLKGDASIPENVKVTGDAISARDCSCSRRGCTACEAGRRGTASA